MLCARINIIKTRKDFMKVEFKQFISVPEFPKNKYIFTLYHHKKAEKYYACIDTIKYNKKEEKIKCKLELKSF